MRNFKRVFSVLALTCGLLAAGAAMGAAAEAYTQPSLNGEVMLAGPDAGASSDTSMFEVTLVCGGSAPSHWTYSASGTATGPYPGTFTETGTVSVDANGLGASAPVLTLHAEFAIMSGTTVVSGTKDLKLAPTNTGSCLAAADSYDASFVASATYSATIDTGSGSFTDSGTSTINTRRSDRFDLSTGTSLGGISRFREDFTSSSGTTPTSPAGTSAVGLGLLGSLRNPIVFGFFGRQTNSGLRGLCGVFDPSRRTLVVCVNVDSFVASDGHAVMTGDAYVNKVKTRYRIDVTDGGSPWGGDSFKIQTDSGYTAQGSLGLLGAIRIR